MVSIVILSIMILFLYQSYDRLNASNAEYKTKVDALSKFEEKKRLIFMDFSLALFGSYKISNLEKNQDIVFLQTSNSIHQRFNPYVAYVMKEEKLYRLESLKPFQIYPLPADSDFDMDYLGEVSSFRVYKSSADQVTFLINIDFKNKENILMKVKGVNED